MNNDTIFNTVLNHRISSLIYPVFKLFLKYSEEKKSTVVHSSDWLRSPIGNFHQVVGECTDPPNITDGGVCSRPFEFSQKWPYILEESRPSDSKLYILLHVTVREFRTRNFDCSNIEDNQFRWFSWVSLSLPPSCPGCRLRSYSH